MPEPVPEDKMYPRVWRALNRFLAISIVTSVVALAVRKCESRVLLKDIL